MLKISPPKYFHAHTVPCHPHPQHVFVLFSVCLLCIWNKFLRFAHSGPCYCYLCFLHVFAGETLSIRSVKHFCCQLLLLTPLTREGHCLPFVPKSVPVPGWLRTIFWIHQVLLELEGNVLILAVPGGRASETGHSSELLELGRGGVAPFTSGWVSLLALLECFQSPLSFRLWDQFILPSKRGALLCFRAH